MKFFFKFGLLAIIFIGANAYAEGNCPQGMYPIGGGNAGWQGCAPIPGYNSGQGQNNAPQGHWEDSYGALVFGDAKEDGSLRYAFSANYSSEDGALKRALNECIAGGDLNCRKETTFWNGYLVLVTGEDGAIYWGVDSKENNAKRHAMDVCNKYTKNCEAFKTIDSRSVWVN